MTQQTVVLMPWGPSISIHSPRDGPVVESLLLLSQTVSQRVDGGGGRGTGGTLITGGRVLVLSVGQSE